MSTETLKFFEDKSTEAIINWMLSHLSEEQIRMCLDQSGIPDTSIPQPSVPSSSSDPGPSSSSDPGPSSLPPVLPSPKVSAATKRFVDKYRNICKDTTYLIKDVSKEGVIYYQFKEVEDEDLIKNPSLVVGDIEWVLKNTPLSEFKTYCTDDDRIALELLKEEAPDKFNTPPPEVRDIVKDYVNNGFPSPIPDMITASVVDTEPIPTPVTTVVEMTDGIKKALKIQQESGPFIQQNYPLLYNNGMTMFPIFIYGSEGNNVLFLSASVQDEKLILVKDMSNKALLNSKFKKILKSIGDAINLGIYTPSSNIPNELNSELPEGDIKNKIQYIYTTVKVSGINFFGTLEDDFDDLSIEEFIDVPEMPYSGSEMKDMQEMTKKSMKKKKVSEMTQDELDKRMLDLFGSEFARDHDAVKYTNSLGVQNVKYVKKCDCDKPSVSRDSSFEEIRKPIFTEFQGKPSVNSGPGKFGELDIIEEDLLFS